MYDLPGGDDMERVMIDRDAVEKRSIQRWFPNNNVAEPTERSA
jgi:hypothetical protein